MSGFLGMVSAVMGCGSGLGVPPGLRFWTVAVSKNCPGAAEAAQSEARQREDMLGLAKQGFDLLPFDA